MDPRKNILVAIPAYNCELQIHRVIEQFYSYEKLYQEILIIDNNSQDRTLNVAIKAGKKLNSRITILRNNFNYGLGGSHKVAFNYCLNKGYDGVVILHGDDQGRIIDFNSIATTDSIGDFDCFLGARFMPESKLTGYSFFRIFGNKIFNILYSLCSNSRVYDMGSGLNYFSRELLLDKVFLDMPDDLTFNNAFLLHMLFNKKKVTFFPISWREHDQVSNAKLFDQSIKLIKYLLIYTISRFKNEPLRLHKKKLSYDYTYKKVN